MICDMAISSQMAPCGRLNQQDCYYVGYLSHDINFRWIVMSNFREFVIHDTTRPNDEPEIAAPADLEKEYHQRNSLVNTGDETIKKG